MTDQNKADEKRLSPEVKAPWLTALRSGHYTQTGDALESGGAYCCLGVLRAVCPQIPRDPDEEYLDDAVATSFGLSPDMQRTLAAMNDDGRDFSYIADYIEKHL